MNRDLAVVVVILLCMGAAVVYYTANGTVTMAPLPIKYPHLEEEFCSTLENAGSTYKALGSQYNAASDAKNGILQDRLSQQMTAVYRQRNVSVFQLLKQPDFRFGDWIVGIENIGAPSGGRIALDLHPACSLSTTVHARTSTDPATIDLLAGLKQGDRMVASGRFVERWGGHADAQSPGPPASPEEFEDSFTKAGSMDQPEYSGILTALSR